LHQFEKVAFLKFFITYFISVAFLILAAGHLYFSQIKFHYLKAEEFSMIEYARHIKMGENLKKYEKEYSYELIQVANKHIDISNFSIGEKFFSKYLPMNRNLDYLLVHKSKTHFKTSVWELKKRVIAVQVFLLLIFGVISYVLARNALKPLNESIVKLDKFAKDLIHDLNTPVTSVKLNMKLLQKIPEIQEHKAWERLNRSIHDISELHENLTLLLQEETFQMEIINLCEIIDEVVSVHKQVYPNLQFVVECEDLKVKINKNAMKQILQNIVVNACKYNTKDGYVKIFTKEKKLFIEDSGKGIKEPDKIFERSYSGEHSSGIGLDIVKRLATAMKIDIEVQTSTQGSTFLLQFN
jgi:two-component system OmpR family sensor kinase